MERMKVEDALEKIDNITNILAAEIPDKIEILGEVYYPKKDISNGTSEKVIAKYEELYQELRDEIKNMEDVPKILVDKAIILRRIILFLKEYSKSDEIEDKKRWIDFVKKIK